MAATKNKRTLLASTSIAAATPTDGTEIDLSTKYGGVLTVKLTNGGTGPTVPINAYVYIGGATTEKKLFAKLLGDSVNSSVNEYAVDIPAGTMFLNITFKDNTAQAVTCEAFLQELTTI
jgi:hypothetical protein